MPSPPTAPGTVTEPIGRQRAVGGRRGTRRRCRRRRSGRRGSARQGTPRRRPCRRRSAVLPSAVSRRAADSKAATRWRCPALDGVERAAGADDPAGRGLAGRRRGERRAARRGVDARTWRRRSGRPRRRARCPRASKATANGTAPGATVVAGRGDGPPSAVDAEDVDGVGVGLGGDEQLAAVRRERDLAGRVGELGRGGRVEAERAVPAQGSGRAAGRSRRSPGSSRRRGR